MERELGFKMRNVHVMNILHVDSLIFGLNICKFDHKF